MVVMKTFRGWHCPHCSYISPSQKGNLKVHILNRHANPGESFGCVFCGKHLSSRSSLQVHISQVHREEQKVRYMWIPGGHLSPNFKLGLELDYFTYSYHDKLSG